MRSKKLKSIHKLSALGNKTCSYILSGKFSNYIDPERHWGALKDKKPFSLCKENSDVNIEISTDFFANSFLRDPDSLIRRESCFEDREFDGSMIDGQMKTIRFNRVLRLGYKTK